MIPGRTGVCLSSGSPGPDPGPALSGMSVSLLEPIKNLPRLACLCTIGQKGSDKSGTKEAKSKYISR